MAKEWWEEAPLAEESTSDAGEWWKDVPLASDAPKARSRGEAAMDGASSFGASVNNTLKTLTDLAGTNNPVSQFLGDNAKTWQGNYSPAYQAELQKQAEEKAALGADPSYADRAGLMAKQVIRNPIEGVGELAGNIAPMMIGGAAGLGVKGMTALSAAMGAGAVKGGIAETVQNAKDADLMPDPLYAEMRRGGLSEDAAKAALSEKRASYGDAYGKILLGAGIGAAVGRFGSVENAIANMGKGAAGQGLLKSIGKEVVTEIPQEMTETYLGNKGAASRGANIAADQGVVEAGVKAGILSAVGGGVAGLSGRAAPKDDTPVVPPVVPPAAILQTESVDDAVGVFNASLESIGSDWQALGITPTGEVSNIAATRAGQEWQDMAPEQTGSLEQQRIELEREGAARSAARDASLAGIGQQWQDLGITNPADDLQAQRMGMRPTGTTNGPTTAAVGLDQSAAPSPGDQPGGSGSAAVVQRDDGGRGLSDTGIPIASDGQGDTVPLPGGVAGAVAPEGYAPNVNLESSSPSTPTFTHTVNPSGTVLVDGDPAAIRAAFPGATGAVKFSDGKPSGVLFGVKSAPSVLDVLQAKAGDVNVQDQAPAPGVGTETQTAAIQAGATVGSNAAATQELPGAGSSAVESVGVKPTRQQAIAAERAKMEAMRNPPAPKKRKGGQTLRASAYDKNPLMTFLATHGLFHDKGKPNSHKSEFSPDKGIMVMGYGPVFKKTGKRLDELTQNAIEEGYLPKDGTEAQLRELVRRAVAGEKISPLYAQGVAEQLAEQSFAEHLAQQQEAAQDEDYDPFQPLDELGYEIEDALSAGRSDLTHALQNEVDALLLQAEDVGIDIDQIKSDAAAETEKGSQDDYLRATKQRLETAISGRAANGNGGSIAQDGEQGRGQAAVTGSAESRGENDDRQARSGSQEGLTAPTREDVLAQQDRADAAKKAEEKVAADAANRSKADAELGEFTLTGSDRAADVGAAGGQQDIFSSPAAEATAILDAADVTGKERIDALKDVKKGDITPEELKAAYPAKESTSFARGKNGAVTNPNDVVGNQGGRSADAVRVGDVFKAPSGEAVTVTRALPGGKVEVRIQGKRTRLGDFKNNELKEWPKIGRADYADGAYTTPQSLIDLAKNESTAPDSGGASSLALGADAFSLGITPRKFMPVADVQKAVDQLTAKWQDGPRIKVVRSTEELPVDAPSDARGLIHNGTAYIVAGNHIDRAGVARTLAHEAIGHYGLWQMLGTDGIRQFQRNLQLALKSGNKPLKAIADQVRALYVDEDGKFNLSPAEEANEIAAFAVENAIDADGNFKPGLGFLKSVFAKVADFLRGLGFNVKFTNAELQGMLVNAMRGMEAGKRLEGGGQSMVAAGRGTNGVVTNPNDVVGNQGGRSADDITPGASKNAPTPDTSEQQQQGRPSFGMQERSVRAVSGSKEPAQSFGGAGSGGYLSTLREVDVFGNGNKIEYYDDAKGLMYSAQKYPRVTKWTAWDVFPKSEGGNQVIGEFDKHRSFDEAMAAVRGARISAALRARNAKYGAIPNTWDGDAKTLAKYLIDASIQIDRMVSSSQSRSKYIYLDDGRKIRLSDHSLPSAYEGADYDLRYGSDIKELVNRIKNESTAPDSGGAFARGGIVGKTNRQHTPEQLRAMKNVGFDVETPTLKERAQALYKDAGKKLAQGIVDQFAPVKDLDKNAYGLLRLAKGASGAFEAFLQGGKLKLTDGVYDFDDANRGGVVDKLLIPLQGEHHDFMRWVASNRAERLQGEGKENLFSAQDIADLKTLANGTTDFDYTVQTGPGAGRVTRDRTLIYADANRVFNEFNKNILDMAEQSGLIDGASRKVWEHEFYVPFYRVADEDGGGVRGMSVKGSVLRQQAFKELKGGKNALNADLLDNTLMNWAHLLDASAKNRAAKATIEAAERMGIAAGGNQSTLAQMGASINNKNGVVWFMDGGQKRYSLIDKEGDGPYLMTAINALEYAGMRNPVMNAMGTMKHILTVGVTASPFFKIRNLIRDSVQVIGTSGINANPLVNIGQGWKLTDPKSDAYFRLLAGGGTIHFGTMLEGSEAKRVQALVESGVDDATILNSDRKVKAFYRKFIEPGITAYNELGNRGEAINRASLYDQLRKQGVNHADASLQARDLMDFSMQGSFTGIRFLTQVVPFLNARLQGLYKLGRAAKEDPARFSMVLGAVAAISLGLLAAYSDDDDWKKREEWDRNNFWWFKFGGAAFRIPKPFEIGAIATLAERGFERAFDKEMTNKRFMAQVMTLLGDNLSMNPIPQLVKPILEVRANKGSFDDRPIETMSMERLKSEYRFTDRTSMTARAASTSLNAITGLVGKEAYSPVQIDHMLRGYFGWLGAFIVGAGDKLARPLTDQKDQATPDYWKVATGGMVSDLSDAPSRYVSAMYDQAKTLEEAYGTYRMLLKEGKTEEAKEFMADHRDELGRYKRVEAVKRTEAKFNERIRMIERSAMDSDAKRDAIRKVKEQKDRVARQLAPA